MRTTIDRLSCSALLGVCVALVAGCAMPPGPFIRSDYTQQKVEDVKKLTSGMSKAQVTEVMGDPVRTEFSADMEAWHYCRTEITVDEYAVVIFRNSKTTQARNYSVVVAGDKSGYEDCAKFIRAALR